MDNVNTLQEYIDAKNNLESVLRRPGRFSTTEETNAMRLFYTASSRPSEEEYIKNALDAANSLPDTSEIKTLLIETINKLTNHYAPKKEETVENNEEEKDVVDERVEKLEKEKERFNNMLRAISDYETGLFNDDYQKTKSFDERKKELEDKIAELENAPVENEIDEKKIEEEFTAANNRINILATRTGKDQTPAMRFYEAAAGIPFVNNIIPALEKAAALSDDDEIKQPLIDALVKLAARYPTLRDEADTKLLDEKMAELGIKPYGATSKSNSEIDKLKQELENIEKEQQEIIEKYKPMRTRINSFIEMIDKELEEIKNNQNSNENTEVPEEVAEQEIEEGPIFVDTERRLDEKDQWLNSSNAANLGKLKEEPTDSEEVTVDEQPTNEEEITPVQPTTDIPEVKEPLSVPKIIKSIKKVGIQTIEKVKSTDYSEKLKSALEWMDKHKKASLGIATGLMIGGMAILGASLTGAEEKNEDKNVNTEITDNNETQNNEENELSETVKTASEIADEAIQEALNGVLEGDSVYRTASAAANDENPRNTTEKQRDNYWAKSQAGAYYDENAKTLTREEAEAKIAAGEEVVVRYDNNGTAIGYVSVGKQNDQTGLSK